MWDTYLNKKNTREWDERLDSTLLPYHQYVSARQFIFERAKFAQIILVNEAHHQPKHKVFTLSLLNELKKAGYTHFGAEALYNTQAGSGFLTFKDTLLNRRKYPICSSGTSVMDSQYGNLIRGALQMGFEVFPYEYAGTDTASGLREYKQALNIKQVLEKQPTAKIIVLCGYGHGCEHSVGGSLATMGNWLKKLTNKNPLTIEQSILCEHFFPEYESPFYRRINKTMPAIKNKVEPLILYKSPATPLNLSNFYCEQDIWVFHPKSAFTYGRPNWLFENGAMAHIVKNSEIPDYPCQLIAYNQNEYIAATHALCPVPVDIIELSSKQEEKALCLYPGKSYVIVIKSYTGVRKQIRIDL
jgi:hypothetical protein